MWRWLGSEATADSPGPRLHRSPSSSDVLRVEQPQQPLFRLAGPLWSFVHEEDAATWAASCHVGTLSPTYKQLLASVSKQLPEVEGTALVINLGPAIADASAYALLGNNVIETTHPPKVPHFDAPPGLACIPLAVMFLVCSNAASWLCLSDKHIVVLHARCCSDSRSAAALVRFLAACYLTFCQEFSSVEEALLVLPSCSDSTQGLPLQRGLDVGHLTTPSKPSGQDPAGPLRFTGPSQQRYAEYLGQLMTRRPLDQPQHASKVLRQVVFSPFGMARSLNVTASTGGQAADEGFAREPFLVVYERGRKIWAGKPAAQGGLVPFEIGLPVKGDVALAVWLCGEEGLADKLLARPAVAYCWHTAFQASGLERVPRTSMDVEAGLTLPDAFFMDIKVDAGTESSLQEGEDQLDGALGLMQAKYAELAFKMSASQGTTRKRVHMDAVLAEMAHSSEAPGQRSPATRQDADGLVCTPPETAGPKLRPLFWTKTQATPGSLWAEVSVPLPTLQAAERQALEKWFVQPQTAVNLQQRQGAAARQQEGTTKLIPLSRANNVSIMLSQFQNYAPEGIRRALLAHKLPLERLSLLLQIAPKEEELKIFHAYRGSSGRPEQLSPPEQFLLVMAGIPRLKEGKIHLSILMHHYQGMLQSLQSTVATIQRALGQVRASERLQAVLRVALAAGNALNAGTHRGNAVGVKLESLLKLSDLKVTRSTGAGSTPVSNLLEFVAWSLIVRQTTSEKDFEKGFLADDLPDLADAAHHLVGLQDALQSLESGYQAAQNEHMAAEASGLSQVSVCLHKGAGEAGVQLVLEVDPVAEGSGALVERVRTSLVHAVHVEQVCQDL
ncbi:hypothetical protein WJX72_006312 [[Myrmecia] bisecta]|uniref:Formin-like protein n=1 Tax=[Myrmecia] bisecta TaxID=41462 RepID=A0AAW1R810_9CHLO